MNLKDIAALSTQLLNDMTMFNGLAKIQQIQTKIIRIGKMVLSLQNARHPLAKTQKAKSYANMLAEATLLTKPQLSRSSEYL